MLEIRPSPSDCVICQIVARKIPSWIVYEDSHTIGFLPLEVEVYGHTIIAPKTHYADIFEAATPVLCELTATAQCLAQHFKKCIGASGVNLLHASGGAAQQSVPHLHIHLLPRFDGDGLNAWPQFPSHDYDKDALLQKLKL